MYCWEDSPTVYWKSLQILLVNSILLKSFTTAQFYLFIFFLGGIDAVEFPIKFTPKKPGSYHCQILLKSPSDIRVYEIECVVNADQADAQLEFLIPAYQTVTQEIPVVSSFLYC